MKNIPRELGSQVAAAARAFPAVVLTGPRRSGKTWLLRHAFPRASYLLLEDPDVIARVRADPRGVLDSLAPPVILDEIQYVPELFPYVRARIDEHPRRTGRWLITGSQEATLMGNVTESMAGRAAVFSLWPLSRRETERVTVALGGFPEVLARPKAARLWFSSYIQTYLERDVRAMLAVRDLATFRRFMALVATRHGQILNRSELAAPLGVSVPTISQWLGVLETTGQVLLVPPYFENAGKRLIKSPKLYVADSGMACHLLGIESQRDLERSPFLGAILEGHVAAEIVKAQVNRGARRELYYFRDQQGLEVDFMVPLTQGRVRLVEVKATHTPMPQMAVPMQRLAAALQKRKVRQKVESMLVYRGSKRSAQFEALAPGAVVRPLDAFVRDPLGR